MKRRNGSVTVFFSLVITILISVLFTVIRAATVNAVRFQTECAADMALQSVLAEYNRELLEQYELFFIETGYGSKESGYILLEQHIRDYMETNLQSEKRVWEQESVDLLGMSTEAVTITEGEGIADGNGAVLQRRAAEYMLQKYGIVDFSDISKIVKETEEKGLLENTMEQKRKKNEAAIKDVDTRVEDENGEKKRIPINNPADKINSRRGSKGILRLVTGGNSISDAEIVESEYISGREYEEKDGFLEERTTEIIGEDLLFQKYIMEKCANYGKPKENSRLAYEMEYVLMGKTSDYENLNAVVNRLLLLRETANFTYLMSDSGKQAEAEALALTLSAVILFPELKDLIKLSILIGWSYAESVNDVRILLAGGSIPLWKTKETWRLSLERAISMDLDEAETISKSKPGDGFSYEAYLHILLALMKKDERNLRFMNVVEMDIRQKPGNENFQINHCVDAFTAEMITASQKGHSCLIRRTVGYWK